MDDTARPTPDPWSEAGIPAPPAGQTPPTPVFVPMPPAPPMLPVSPGPIPPFEPPQFPPSDSIPLPPLWDLPAPGAEPGFASAPPMPTWPPASPVPRPTDPIPSAPPVPPAPPVSPTPAPIPQTPTPPQPIPTPKPAEPAVDLKPAVDLTHLEKELGGLAQSQASLAQSHASLAQSQASAAEAQEALTREMREIRKLYHTEFAGRLQAMQAELDRYHEADRGRQFEGILGALARLYDNHEPLLGDITDATLAKRTGFLFMDLADLLAEHSVGLHKSKPGDKRSPRYCQVVDKIATADEALHDTVVRSRNTGFYIENRPLVKERVDVYVYTPTPDGTPTTSDLTPTPTTPQPADIPAES